MCTEIDQTEKSDIMFRPYLVVSHFFRRSKFYKVVNHCVSQRFLHAFNPAPALPRILPPSSLFSEKMARYVILSLSGITLVANNYDETQITSKVLKAIASMQFESVEEIGRQCDLWKDSVLNIGPLYFILLNMRYLESLPQIWTSKLIRSRTFPSTYSCVSEMR